MEGYGNENPGAFQPTRPLRGATEIAHKLTDTIKFQPTRPLRGATPCFHRGIAQSKFQPTRPLRGATVRAANRSPIGNISTHAPLAGRDSIVKFNNRFHVNFNPRAPCGARQNNSAKAKERNNFNPRAPCGARQQKCTNHYAHFCDNRQISDAFAQNAACQGILLLFDAGKSCGFWVRTAQVISAHLCFAL